MHQICVVAWEVKLLLQKPMSCIAVPGSSPSYPASNPAPCSCVIEEDVSLPDTWETQMELLAPGFCLAYLACSGYLEANHEMEGWSL